MPGLIQTGGDYQRRVIGGMFKQSGEEVGMWERSKALSAQEEAQKSQTSATAVGAGASVGFIGGAALTAEATETAAAGALSGLGLGAWGGPIGMVIGAGLGFAFSKLF